MAVNLPKADTIIAIKFWCISVKIGKILEMSKSWQIVKHW
jgi:hypothetical protein